MTIVLGVGIGHDAAAAVLRDGVLLSHVLRERHSRVRHHLGIDRDTIERALAQAGITTEAVDAVAVTATQQMNALVDDADYFSFAEVTDRPPSLRPPLRLIDNPWWGHATSHVVERWSRRTGGSPQAAELLAGWEASRRLPMDCHRDWEMVGVLTPLFGPRDWLSRFGLAETSECMRLFLALTQGEDPLPTAFEFPVVVTLGGREIPGWFVHHHMAHAASNWSCAPAPRGMIVTHDGGTGSDSGFVFLAEGNTIAGVGPHFLEGGQFYDYVAERLGLGTVGGAGKLMGLASYGRGVLDGLLPPGTRPDWEAWARTNDPERAHTPYAALFEHLVAACRARGMDVSTIGDAARVTEEAPCEIAHAVQRLLEECMDGTVTAVAQALQQAEYGEYTEVLGLSGGVALNCPSNTRLAASGRFAQVHVEPHCEDGGLAIGGAWYVHTNLLGRDAPRPSARLTSAYGMMGPAPDDALASLLAPHGDALALEPCDDWALQVAEALLADQVVGVFEGGYETGPRALGHRSILANPTVGANWRRVNAIKGREAWRPFAPVVRAEDLFDWFEGGPADSPFMLFTYRVRDDKAGQLPAITHVDQTARVQTVTASDGALHRILSHLAERGAVPVVLNTSFNGPGEPIVQHPEQALRMLLEHGLDAVFIDGRKVVRRAAVAVAA